MQNHRSARLPEVNRRAVWGASPDSAEGTGARSLTTETPGTIGEQPIVQFE